MELNKKTMMKLALLVFLLSFTSTMVDATTTACCDSCPCTKSIPPQCHCTDIGETCHSACKSCLCTKSIPPQCHCADITDFCYPKCN
ncbi:Bowman birk trypsin inhibitor [Medicago truncatula]|uniref:Bowman birk trypsin inhibitor n=1 Tax=Medicago truncatula TaxID=3880 RepID=G7L3N0_MEDTR|nr:Bowman birk trypsin inhibitor [Medicago truncatula]